MKCWTYCFRIIDRSSGNSQVGKVGLAPLKIECHSIYNSARTFACKSALDSIVFNLYLASDLFSSGYLRYVNLQISSST